MGTSEAVVLIANGNYIPQVRRGPNYCRPFFPGRTA